jgi:hypothetical protein
MDCLGEGDRQIVVCAVIAGEAQSIEGEHPERQVVVILPIAVRTCGGILPNPKASGERGRVRRAGEARFLVTSPAEGIMNCFDEAFGEIYIVGVGRLSVQGEEV